MASRWKCWHCRSLLLLALGGVAAVVLLAGGRREGEQTSPALSIPSATAPVPLIQKPQGSQAQDGASGRSLKAEPVSTVIPPREKSRDDSNMPPVQVDRRVMLRLADTQPARVVAVHGLHRIVLPSVPRTGNGWIRGLLEAATGVATESFYTEPNATYSNRSNAESAPCGWLQDCATVHQGVGRDPVVVKTHFPFMTSGNKTALLRSQRADVGDASFLILPVRNPLDNHAAWTRYLGVRSSLRASSADTLTFQGYMREWADHHTFWFNQHVPCFVYRYEDLVDQPLAVLQQVLVASGLWEYYGLNGTVLERASGLRKLKAYRRKQHGSDDLSHSLMAASEDDLHLAIEAYGPLLERYGYLGLYNLILSAKQKEWSMAEVTARVDEEMRRTAPLATWGDHVRWPQ